MNDGVNDKNYEILNKELNEILNETELNETLNETELNEAELNETEILNAETELNETEAKAKALNEFLEKEKENILFEQLNVKQVELAKLYANVLNGKNNTKSMDFYKANIIYRILLKGCQTCKSSVKHAKPPSNCVLKICEASPAAGGGKCKCKGKCICKRKQRGGNNDKTITVDELVKLVQKPSTLNFNIYSNKIIPYIKKTKNRKTEINPLLIYELDKFAKAVETKSNGTDVDEDVTKTYFKGLIIDMLSGQPPKKTKVSLSRDIVAMHILLKLCPSKIIASEKDVKWPDNKFENALQQFDMYGLCMLLKKVEDDLIWTVKYLSIDNGDITTFYQVWMKNYYNKSNKIDKFLSRFEFYNKYKYDPSLFIETFKYIKSKKDEQDGHVSTNSHFIDSYLGIGGKNAEVRKRVIKILQDAVNAMLTEHDNTCTNCLRFVCYYFTDVINLSENKYDIKGDIEKYEEKVAIISNILIEIISYFDNWYNVDFEKLEIYIKIWGIYPNNAKSILQWHDYFTLIKFTLNTGHYERVIQIPITTYRQLDALEVMLKEEAERDAERDAEETRETEEAKLAYKEKKIKSHIEMLELFQGNELKNIVSLCNGKQNIKGMNNVIKAFIGMCLYDKVGPEIKHDTQIYSTSHALTLERIKLRQILTKSSNIIEELVGLVSFTEKGKQYWSALHDLFVGSLVPPKNLFLNFDPVFVQKFNEVNPTNFEEEKNAKKEFTTILIGSHQTGGFKIVKTYLQTPLMCNDGRIRRVFRLKGRGNVLYVMCKKKVTKRSDIEKKPSHPK